MERAAHSPGVDDGPLFAPRPRDIRRRESSAPRPRAEGGGVGVLRLDATAVAHDLGYALVRVTWIETLRPHPQQERLFGGQRARHCKSSTRKRGDTENQ